MVVSDTSRGQCLYTHHCIVVFVFSIHLALPWQQLVAIDYKKVFLICLQKTQTEQWLHSIYNSIMLETSYTWLYFVTSCASGQYHSNPTQQNRSFFAVSCDHSDSLLRYVNNQSLSVVRPGLYSPSSCSQGGWNVLTLPYGENTQTMSNFVILPPRLNFWHTDTSQSSLPKSN